MLTVTNKHSPIVTNYILHGQALKNVKSAKYFGITITSDLKWNTYIDNIRAKANKTLGFVKRNVGTRQTPIKTKEYQALVRPTLEYCTCVWDPYTQGGVRELESVQRRAARYCLYRYHNTSSMTDMLNFLNWKTLEERRTISRLIMLSCCYNISPISPTKTKTLPYSPSGLPTISNQYQCF